MTKLFKFSTSSIKTGENYPLWMIEAMNYRGQRFLFQYVGSKNWLCRFIDLREDEDLYLRFNAEHQGFLIPDGNSLCNIEFNGT